MQKQYYFTKHVLNRMKLRLVTKKQVIDCIEKPQISEKKEDLWIAKKIQKDGRLLMVVFDRKTRNIISIITVIKTSKINKYL